ncbi:hypothetical protein NE619_17485 [Anaerovorax odorimutans]|uniref:Uncharacterized protein n=1 Tax=Anaerovorax odorimutans TaxID=109327 RepID=A0ABT1RTJ4_9FIRM|nr:hypothetical protein [Anaerovorax odorimutans]MCQ4638524.1 hypothetical protein [Anaerovorax odorimutans]
MQMQEPCEKREEVCIASNFKEDGSERMTSLENKLLRILCRELSNEHEEYIIV